MSKNFEIHLDIEYPIKKNQGKSQKPYYKPTLKVLGDLRAITLGGSVAVECESAVGEVCVDWTYFGGGG